MLNKMWVKPPCRNKYVNGCQSHNRPKTAAGVKPNHGISSGTICMATKVPTFAQISAFTTGVTEPGPNEASVDEGAYLRIACHGQGDGHRTMSPWTAPHARRRRRVI